jgi:hypothetical protein
MGFEFAKEETTIKKVIKDGTLEVVENHLKKVGLTKRVMGIELDEPPILGHEDNTIIKGNMTFSIEINTIICPHTQLYLLINWVPRRAWFRAESRIERRNSKLDRVNIFMLICEEFSQGGWYGV